MVLPQHVVDGTGPHANGKRPAAIIRNTNRFHTSVVEQIHDVSVAPSLSRLASHKPHPASGHSFHASIRETKGQRGPGSPVGKSPCRYKENA